MRQLWGFRATKIVLGLYRANDPHKDNNSFLCVIKATQMLDMQSILFFMWAWVLFLQINSFVVNILYLKYLNISLL